MNERQQWLADHPHDGIVVSLDDVEYVAGDARFTCWMRRDNGERAPHTITDELDARLLAMRRA